ncbi:radical SAM/SPASM domain-containing protein [Paenibacillus pseudetheri]|uniref:GTP 3',8-cyclase n=1 Tax=Paenibacillus pseudetheri TaxID=2897682 RepID=A0ABM9BKN1_9BACL|nr:radical SAM protein [Paenibacillus pseudetheri]CAH1059047.1 GTP 3',8-cyclase [Paenibacillus pseudetheri]
MYKVELELLKNCNLHCAYCYQTHSNQKMDPDIAKEAIDFGIKNAKELHAKQLLISYFGGEPLLRINQIRSLTEYAISSAQLHNIDVFFEITTNATLFNQNINNFFIENNFSLKISLDGSQYYHDLNRLTINGGASYEAITKNMDSFITYQRTLKKPVQVSMVISKNTYQGFFSNIKHLLSLGFRLFDTTINFNDNWSLEEFKQLKIEFEKTADFYAQKAKSGQWFCWTFIDKGIKPQLRTRKNYFCGAGATSVFVNTAGDLFPCFACFKDEALIGTLSDGFRNKSVERFKHYKRNLSDTCLKCEIKPYCTVCDCLMMNLEMTGDFHNVPMIFCELEKIRYELIQKLLLDPEWNEAFKKVTIPN